MRLKSQRQLLLLGIALLAALAAIMAAMVLRDRTAPEIVPLGKGMASIEMQPVAAYDPLPQTARDPSPEPSPSESPMAGGEASYYGSELAGNPTASGESFNPEGLTAAHRTLPLGSRVRVTNPTNGESVVVRINDRGPFHANRVIDLSTAAARRIGLIRTGTGRVSLALIV